MEWRLWRWKYTIISRWRSRVNKAFQKKFHPFDKAFSFFDNNFTVKRYNDIKFTVSLLTLLKFFLIRVSEARNYFEESMITKS